MSENRAMQYAEILSKLIQVETISTFNQTDKTKFYNLLFTKAKDHLFRKVV